MSLSKIFQPNDVWTVLKSFLLNVCLLRIHSVLQQMAFVKLLFFSHIEIGVRNEISDFTFGVRKFTQNCTVARKREETKKEEKKLRQSSRNRLHVKINEKKQHCNMITMCLYSASISRDYRWRKMYVRVAKKKRTDTQACTKKKTEWK